MRNTTLAIGFLTLITPAAAKKAQIEAANVKWMEFFNKGDFDGAASLYNATAFPPGSGMVKDRFAIAAMWKSVAEHVVAPKLTTLDVQTIGTLRGA